MFSPSLFFFSAYKQISPGNDATFHSIYPPHILSIAFGNKGFVLNSRLTQLSLASMKFVFLGPELYRRLPSDFTSR